MVAQSLPEWDDNFGDGTGAVSNNHSPPEGESQKPSRQAPADAVGG